jgi:hypothetical protein
MDGDQREEMNQASVDRELRALLAVDPSPAFVARMRERIADEPLRASWWSPRSMVVATVSAAAAAAVVIGFVLIDTRPEAPRSAEAVALPAEAVALPADAVASRGSAQGTAPIVRGLKPTRMAPPVVVHLATRPRPRQPAPHAPVRSEIVIDPREASALRALMRGVGDGRIDLKPVLAATTLSVMELSPIDDLAIAPLIFPPLEEGARQ